MKCQKMFAVLATLIAVLVTAPTSAQANESVETIEEVDFDYEGYLYNRLLECGVPSEDSMENDCDKSVGDAIILSVIRARLYRACNNATNSLLMRRNFCSSIGMATCWAHLNAIPTEWRNFCYMYWG